MVKYLLNQGAYFCPTPFWENETMSTKQITKKEEPLNLNLAEPSEVAFPVSFC